MQLTEGIRDLITYKLVGTDILIDAVAFESSDPTVVSVSAKGDLVPLKAGKATVTIKSVANEKVTATVEITVNASPYSLNEGFSVINKGGQYPVSFIPESMKKISLNTSVSTIGKGTPANELTYKLPSGDFSAKIMIDSYAENYGLGGGVIVHLGNGKFVTLQRGYNDKGARILCTGEGVKTADIQDFLTGAKNKPYIVTVKVENGTLSLIGGFYENNTRTFASVKLAEGAELSIGVFAISESDESNQDFVFSNFSINDVEIPFALDASANDDPSVDPSEDPSVAPSDETPVESEGEDDEKDKGGDSVTALLIVGIIVIAVAAVVAVVIVVVLKKKKN
jgi:hypothetical protein